jgi:anti-sigma B factor antagonist
VAQATAVVTEAQHALYPGIAVSEPIGALFEIHVSSTGGDIEVVALRGELDFDQAPALTRTLADLRADGARAIVVDLSELTFIDSSGISVLVATARASAADECMLVLAAPTAHVQRVFDIVSLSELVAVEPALEAALQRIGRGREQTAG